MILNIVGREYTHAQYFLDEMFHLSPKLLDCSIDCELWRHKFSIDPSPTLVQKRPEDSNTPYLFHSELKFYGENT